MMLITHALALYNKRFEDIDAQAGEIIGALKAVERQAQFIRSLRDHLLLTLRDWDPLLKWRAEIGPKHSRPMDQLLADTYRLLAARFASVVSHMKRLTRPRTSVVLNFVHCVGLCGAGPIGATPNALISKRA